jgi:murein L,D-transpeptidase YafK
MHFKFGFIIILLLFASLLFSQTTHLNYQIQISKLIEDINKDSISILIEKSEYKLTILYNDKRIKSYPVVFGSNPIDDKLRQGDSCTPEGIFKVRALYPHKSWSKFIWIDYPTDNSWKNHNTAKSNGTISQNSSIGGEIGIHGVPAGYDNMIDEKYNWTLGCISLKNVDVNEIYKLIKVGTRIEIRH